VHDLSFQPSVFGILESTREAVHDWWYPLCRLQELVGQPFCFGAFFSFLARGRQAHREKCGWYFAKKCEIVFDEEANARIVASKVHWRSNQHCVIRFDLNFSRRVLNDIQDIAWHGMF